MRMSTRLLIVLLSLALGAVSGAFGWSLIAGKRQAAALAAARAEGRKEAEKALSDELAALKPVTFAKTADAETKPGGVQFGYEYMKPKNAALEPFYKMAHDGDMLRHIPEVQAIDGMLMLPRPINYVTAECGEVNAFYSPERNEVVMCYETMKVLEQRGRELAAHNKLPDTYAQQYLDANFRFILLHETGHALITLLEIPITGREEDAVDQLATTLMLRFAGLNESTSTVTENLRMASNWFLARSTGEYNLDAYADQHALGEQRYFNLQCLLYGSDPERFASIGADGDLPESRAVYCPREARRAQEAWVRLLMPHFSPARPELREEAERWLQQRRHRPAP